MIPFACLMAVRVTVNDISRHLILPDASCCGIIIAGLPERAQKGGAESVVVNPREGGGPMSDFIPQPSHRKC
jgi:hypothetical protein